MANKSVQKMLLHRGLQAIVLVLLLRFILSLRWGKIWEAADQLPTAIFLTIQLTVISLVLGFVIAWPLALLRAKRKNEWLAHIADGYVAVFRGTPLLVQVYLIYYGLGGEEWIQDSFLWPAFKSSYFCVVLGFTLNSSAYACEIFRGALVNGGKGEREAAQALGLSPFQVDWLVWVPASWRRALPQYGNEMIFMMHGTAIAGLVTMMEVFGVTKNINRSNYMYLEGNITAALIYIALTAILVQIAKWMERRYLSFNKR